MTTCAEDQAWADMPADGALQIKFEGPTGEPATAWIVGWDLDETGAKLRERLGRCGFWINPAAWEPFKRLIAHQWWTQSERLRVGAVRFPNGDVLTIHNRDDAQ
jgi:hypothetical protein